MTVREQALMGALGRSPAGQSAPQRAFWMNMQSVTAVLLYKPGTTYDVIYSTDDHV